MLLSAVLELERVARVHGRGAAQVHALRDVSLVIQPGEFVALTGPSGSGKSTLLQVAGGLDRPSSGAIRVRGQDMLRLRKWEVARLRRREIGFVFQHYNLLPSLTSVENVALPLDLDGMPARSAIAQARRALAEVGLEGMGDRVPADLSGGEQQRVAIARAIVGERSLLLADEPTGALDTKTGMGILSLLRDRSARGTAVVLVTHDARYAMAADRVIHLRDGVVVDQSSPDPVIPANRAQ